MKALLALLFLIGGGTLSRATEDLPKPLGFQRYEAMMNRSPFAVATAATPPPQAPNFAKDLYIANAAKLADEGVVTLNSNVDKNLKEYLSTKGPNKDGYSISNIEWSDRVGATKVTIAKDGQFATLTFNQALLSQPAPNQPAQPQAVPQPVAQPQVGTAIPGSGAMPTPIQGIPAAAVPAIPVQTPPPNAIRQPQGLPTPPPRVRGVIQRNPSAIATPVADDRAQLRQDQ